MAESAAEVFARALAHAGPDGRLPRPPIGEWDIFPWEAADGVVVPKPLPAPADEPVRYGDGDPTRPCGECAVPSDRIVWEDEFWHLRHTGGPTGLPLVLLLSSREHLDFGDLDDELASQFGRISNRLVRIIEALDNIGRCHVYRIGDGGAHLHIWFMARTAGLATIMGSYAVEWDDILPPGPEDVWRADLRTIGTKLANWGGQARN